MAMFERVGLVEFMQSMGRCGYPALAVGDRGLAP